MRSHDGIGCGVAGGPGVEEVLVPAGRLDSRAVPGGVGEAGRGPRCPRRGDGGLRQALEPASVGGRRGERRRVQGRGVERAADDGHGRRPGGEDRPQHLPHRRLAALVVLVAQPGVVAAHLRHGRGEHGEPLDRGVMALLDGVLPPALGVGVAGCPGEHRDRVLPHGRARGPAVGPVVGRAVGRAVGRVVGRLDDCLSALLAGSAPEGEVVARRQVGEPDRDAVPQRPPDRHPLGRERRHRVEARASRVGDVVDEPGDRRSRAGVGEQRHDLLELGWPLDDDHVRGQRVEGERHRPGRARAVVSHPEDVDRHALSPARGRRGRGRTTRGGRGRPSRGTPARRAGPGRGP